VRQVEAYSRLAGLYDEIVIDPCHDRCASYLHELWSDDADGVRSVLDLCCGTGLLAGELIARGYAVVGVDASEAMLALARRRLGPETVLRRMTLPDLTVEGVFDAAVCTFDGFNYLTPDELSLTIAAVAGRLRRAGWLVFDLHTDAMMDFTIANAIVAGESAGNDFVISSVVDPSARTCDTRIELTRPRDGDPFCEQHRQHFHTDTDVRASLQDAGFAVTAVSEEYTHQPADAATLCATWIARRRRSVSVAKEVVSGPQRQAARGPEVAGIVSSRPAP
jgi:predicted TPR repeat methyltransferase